MPSYGKRAARSERGLLAGKAERGLLVDRLGRGLVADTAERGLTAVRYQRGLKTGDPTLARGVPSARAIKDRAGAVILDRAGSPIHTRF